jgi:hypothetical protein
MSKWLIGGIVLLAFLLRVPFLDLYPIGFTPDEASFGYDAYSILHTGKDQWGHSFPFVLESFGDFKAPLYTYLDIPFVAILGLTKTAVRLPNALLGVGAVWVVYLLVTELSLRRERKQSLLITDKKTQIPGQVRHDVGIIAALFLAISPWHIQLSRGAFEANMISFFVPLGILLFLKGLKNKKYLPWSAFIFGLSLFTYHTAKVITPLMVGFVVVLYWNNITRHAGLDPVSASNGGMGKRQIADRARNDMKYTIIATLIFCFFVIATGITFLNGAGSRVTDISIFNGALESQALDRLSAIQGGLSPVISKLFYNKYVVSSQRFATNYISYFSLNFLFQNGAREGTYGMIPGFPVLYWFELPLFLFFILYSVRHYRKKYIWLILFWLFISPIPASLTQGVGHAANRAASMLPVLQIASAIGLYQLYLVIKQLKYERLPRVLRILAMMGGGMIVLFSFVGFLKTYILFSPGILGRPMLYNNLEVAYWLRDNTKDTTNIIVSTSLSEPHIYIAFANSWDANSYQSETKDWHRYHIENRTFLDQLSVYSLGKYTFKHIEKKDLIESSETLLVGRASEFPNDLEIIKQFNYPTGEPAIVVVSPYEKTYAYKN